MKTPFSLLALLFPMLLLAQSNNAFNPSITTVGRAHVYAIPDEVLVDVQIRNEDDDLSKARESSDSQARAVLALCKRFGIAPEHAQSKYRRYGRNYRHKVGQPKFEASQTINICLKDLSRYDDFMQSLIALEVYSVGGAFFRTTEHRKHMDEARKKAVHAAKEKAQMLAGELDQSIGRAITINEVTGQRSWNPNQAYANVSSSDSGGSDADGSSFSPGQIKIEAEVSITFALN